jgi:pimeloyl-ACP methyl ester carboxylesterase
MELFINESGELQAPALVFLHGSGVAGWMWESQMIYFRDYRVIVPDLPGHGRSEAVPFLSIHNAALKVMADIHELIGTEKIILIGFSLGAQIAVEILSHWPDRVDSAVIISPLVKPLKYKKLALAVSKMSFGLIKSRFFSRLQAKSLFIPKCQFQRYYEDSNLITRDNLIRMLVANMSYTIPESFPHAAVRTLVMAGGREKKFMIESITDLAHMNRNCTGYQLPGMKHGLPFIAPDLLNEILHGFIDNVHLNKHKKLKRVI